MFLTTAAPAIVLYLLGLRPKREPQRTIEEERFTSDLLTTFDLNTTSMDRTGSINSFARDGASLDASGFRNNLSVTHGRAPPEAGAIDKEY